MHPKLEAVQMEVHDNASSDMVPTEHELQLLHRLRTLDSADYEAQYLDNKPHPRGDGINKMGNPSALGISVFAVANTMIGLFLLQVRGIQQHSLLVGVLWFTGGLGSWLTAIFELLLGNTFAWCVFASFGSYYFAFASTMTPAFGIAESYDNPAELNQALGVFFCVWATLFLIFLVCGLRTNLIFCWIFGLVDLTAWLLAASYFQEAAGNTGAAVKLAKTGGGFLFTGAMGGWYLLIIQLTESLAFGFKLPIGSLIKEEPKERND